MPLRQGMFCVPESQTNEQTASVYITAVTLTAEDRAGEHRSCTEKAKELVQSEACAADLQNR